MPYVSFLCLYWLNQVDIEWNGSPNKSIKHDPLNDDDITTFAFVIIVCYCIEFSIKFWLCITNWPLCFLPQKSNEEKGEQWHIWDWSLKTLKITYLISRYSRVHNPPFTFLRNVEVKVGGVTILYLANLLIWGKQGWILT